MPDQDHRQARSARSRTREIGIVLAAFLVAIAVGLAVRHGVIDPHAVSPQGDIAAR